jgi:starch-binding outer membrane protein, SusD/RagB family
MKKIIYLMVVVQLFCLSCKKYLDEPPSTNLGYPTTIANCQALLDNYQVMNIGRTPNLLEASCDNYFLLQTQFNSISEPSRDAYLWQIPFFSVTNDWILAYAPIYHANVCLENIEKIERSDNVGAWNNVKGSALFFRAYYFLSLSWTYGKAYDETTSNDDLGIVLKKNTDLYEPNYRASVKQTYEQIIADARQAIQYLPDTATHPLRPSKAAAYGLLARTFLSMRWYDSAGKYADKYLSLKNKLIDFNGDPDLVSGFTTNISPFRVYNKETCFYSTTTLLLNIPGITSSHIDSTLYASYHVDDLRRTAFFSGAGPYKSFKGTYTQDVLEQFSGIATDEIYLIRAECYARRGDKDNALADLNALLVKRWIAGTFVPVTAASPEIALTIILQERRKELLMRSLRWADIKRLNKEPIYTISLIRIVNGQTYTLLPNDNRYALPIPEIIISQSGIQQNPR